MNTRSAFENDAACLPIRGARRGCDGDTRVFCEASAGAFIDGTHFAVASDETNRLQIYERGKPEPIGNGDRHGGFYVLRQIRSRSGRGRSATGFIG